MRIFEEKERCSGCTACEHSCPQGAIAMARDGEGFLYPEIDREKCNECGLCRKICPFHRDYPRPLSYEPPWVYAARHADVNVRRESTSGGMFTALSDYVLSKKGMVYGAVYGKPDFKVRHSGAETPVERDLMRGSKYVQSEPGGLFPEIKKELDCGRYVLFTGTPCQAAGVRAFLGEFNYENLILCDLVCMGVTSPLLWRDYVFFLQRSKGKALDDFRFRDKSAGWHRPAAKAIFAGGCEEQGTELTRAYTNLFYRRFALRPSCHSCFFTNFSRVSDITMADFWGIEEQKTEFDDGLGVSLVLVNTPIGSSVLDAVKNVLVLEKSSKDECLGRQVHLKRPAEPSPLRNAFREDYNGRGIEFVLQKYCSPVPSQSSAKTILRKVLLKMGLLGTVKKLLGPTSRKKGTV